MNKIVIILLLLFFPVLCKSQVYSCVNSGGGEGQQLKWCIGNVVTGIYMQPDYKLWHTVYFKNEMPDFVQSCHINNSIYPNPASDFINISYAGINSEKKIIQIINMAGECVFRNESLSDTDRFKISHLQNGIYMIRISDGNSNVLSVSKFIKTFKL